MKLPSDYKLGIIGGGQLARMSTYQAYRYGIQAGAITSVSGNDPMEQVTPHIFRGGVSDFNTLKKLAEWADVVTLENEFLDGNVLQEIHEQTGTPIYPTPASFKKIENKRIEKDTFRNAGIPVARYMIIQEPDDLAKAGAKFGWPYILKSSKGGYDGYGNASVGSAEEAAKAFSKLGGTAGKEIIAEERVDFVKELAVITARNKFGMVTYPCVETIQENHICKTVIAPARIPKALREQACELARAATEAIHGIGLFAFEFFLTEDNQILLNESAPRPHNSGHYTIEGCKVSQFENHIRAVTGLPPAPAPMLAPAAVMVNLLGKVTGKAVLQLHGDIQDYEHAHIHVYGKSDSRKGRKMGHITLTGLNQNELLEKAAYLEQQIIL